MNKKYLIILFSILIIICGFASILFKKKYSFDDENKTLDNIISEDEKNTNKIESEYIMEKKIDIYEAVLEESENKEYVTLFMQTNIFENKRNIKVEYNSKRLLLNTANPLLENIKIEKNDESGYKSFEIEINSLENYGMIFIKKDINSKIESEDVILNEI